MSAPAPAATRPSGTAVELRGVWKRYRQRQRSERLGDVLRSLLRPRVISLEALRGVDLRVARGEILAYAGPNGAGKSTTIKLLCGLLAADQGEVRVLGLDPVRQRVACVGRIAAVFGQRTELWWDHPVAASFAWKRVVWNVPGDRYERSLAFVRELLELDLIWQTLARELSLGQRMRADLGLALVHDPELLLLDEPTLGLDVLAKQRMLGAIRDLNAERGVTVMITSHDMPDLEQLRARVVMLHRGDIAFDGSFDELRSTIGDRRRLFLETADTRPPELEGASLIGSEGSRHEYLFDATASPIPGLLAQAAAQTTLVDVETHRAPIDDVVAEVYQRLRGLPAPAQAADLNSQSCR
ncbi:MAG TPA: ATP-binding cassette domain-containing protein [Candidatus Dormibacteraeota bacterium]|jgi:ABC-2 type transport system ATP-binding protein|nr:ATP-binding cassette domain-containing protein [Candidatus Dormibacteraeota bacterium]